MTARGQWLPQLYGGQAPPRGEGRVAMMRASGRDVRELYTVEREVTVT